MNIKSIKKAQLKELIDPETFKVSKGDDYGDGRLSTTTKVTSYATTDKIVQATKARPNSVTSFGAPVGYIGEDSLSETILPKDDDDRDLVNKNKSNLTKVRSLLDDIDFSMVDQQTKDTLKAKIDG